MRMDIFPNVFYEPNEEETGLDEFKERLEVKREKRFYLNKIQMVDLKKIPFNPINLDDET